MWKFIVNIVHDFVSSLQPDVGRGFLHVSNVFLLYVASLVQCDSYVFRLCALVITMAESQEHHIQVRNADCSIVYR